MADVKPGELFPSVSKDLSVTFIFWIWMFGLLAASNVTGLQNQFGAINPTILFSLGFLGLGFIAFREANNFQQLKKVIGADVGIPGFGILTFATGLGIGLIVYALMTKQLFSIANSQTLSSIAVPFYTPFTASASAFTFNITDVFSVIFINVFVAVFEEAYKIGIYKNLSNGLHNLSRKYSFIPKIPTSFILLFSLLTAIILWGTWHYFSWNGLTVASIAISIIYGLVFLTGYILTIGTNLVPSTEMANEQLSKVLSAVIIYPAVGSHLAWNVLVSGQFGISGTELLVAGSTITGISLGLMYLIRRFQV
jgi:hypothetical protein